ncbi:MAG TPA: DUF2631 domain-containing protein [Pseudonocardia sp.]|nr:DUF2631 domain-containing protein [Pseudonocardia sp.]
MARNSRELARRPAVDPTEEPSTQWGWHGSFPKGEVIGGVVSIVFLLLFAIGPYQSRTQDLWLIGTALVIALLLVRKAVARRNSWRR